MAQKKVGWTGHIKDDWLSFDKNNKKQDIQSNDNNIPDNIKFYYEENKTASPRSTTVLFTQNKTNKQIILPVSQKAGHVEINTSVTESNFSYTQELIIDPKSDSIGSDERSYKFNDFTYKLTESYDSITSFTWSDTGEPDSKKEHITKEPIYVHASSSTKDDNDFKTEILVAGKSVTGTSRTVEIGPNFYRKEQNYSVKVTYIGDKKPTDTNKVNGKDYNVATITQSANTTPLALTIKSKNLEWKYNEFGENNVKIIAISPIFTVGNASILGIKYKYDVSPNSLKSFTYLKKPMGDLNISAYPNSENNDEANNIVEELAITASCVYFDEPISAETTVTLTQEKAPKSKTEYDFEVEPIRLEWPGNSYGEETAQTLSVTSRTRTYREGEDANSANWKAVPFTASNLTHFKYDGAKDPQIVYPISANTSISVPITETLTFTQNESNYVSAVTLTHYQKDLIFFKSDYLILKYSWDGDTDIDTATVINTPLTTPDKNVRFDAAPIGFNQVGTTTYQNSTNKFLKYGGDTRTSGEEGALIDLKSLSEYISGLTTDVKNEYFRLSDGSYVVEIEVYANHFSGDTTLPAQVSYTSYVQQKGKTISYTANTDSHTFTVENGDETANGSADIKVFAKGIPNANGDFRTCYTKVANIYYNLETGTVMMNTNASFYFDDKSGNTLYGYRGSLSIKDNPPTTDFINENRNKDYHITGGYYDTDTQVLPITGGTFYAKINSNKENIDGSSESVPAYITYSSTTNSPTISYDSKTQILSVTLSNASNIKDNLQQFIPATLYIAQEMHTEQRLKLSVHQFCTKEIVHYFHIRLNNDVFSEYNNRYICVNSDGTSLSNQQTTISSNYSDGTQLPFVLSCTTANAINTITGNGDSTVVFTSKSVNSNKQDIIYTMHGIQYDKDGKKVLEEKDFKVLQLGTYKLEINPDENTKLDFSCYTTKELTNRNGENITYTFTVISNDDKGNSIDFKAIDTTQYEAQPTKYTEHATVIPKGNSFTITIPQNVTSSTQYFYFEVTQNVSENKRYIKITNGTKS